MKSILLGLTAIIVAVQLGCGDDKPARRAPRAAASKPKAGNGDTTTPPANAEPTGWATLTGTFVYDGAVPEREAITVTGDNAAQCGPFNLRSESLLVNEANNGISDVFVFLRGMVDHHESYNEQENASIQLSNKDCRFEPHALGIWLPQTLRVTNDDPFGHNTNINSPGDREANSNMTVQPNSEQTTQFTRRQTSPFPVTCNIHPWMRALVLPSETPYFAVTDENGKFTIANVPAGIELEFQVWHEKSANLNADPSWNNGRFKVTLEPDQTMDLGEIKAVAALFNK